MNYKKNLLVLLGIMLSSTAVMAQETAEQQWTKGPLKSYNFVEVQGGVQLTATDAKMDKLLTPAVGVSVGRFFTPAVGARLHVTGWESKSGITALDTYYKWKYITTDLDLMLNLTNLFSKDKSNFLNVMLIGGIGLNTAWDKDEPNKLAVNNPGLNMPYVYDESRLSHNIRAGLRLETNVTKPVGVSLEITANSLDDRFNSKYNNQDDWMFTGMIGLSFRFGHKYKKIPVPVIEKPAPKPEPKPEPKPVVAPTPPPAPKPVEKKVETLREENFYAICSSDAKSATEQLKKTADFMKRNPEATVTVTGYADKGTGTPKINMKYAKKRAQAITDALVKEYGVDKARIVTDAKGDTVQPFAENDKNRCVIIEGKSAAK